MWLERFFLCDRWIKNVKNSFISSHCEDATQTAKVGLPQHGHFSQQNRTIAFLLSGFTFTTTTRGHCKKIFENHCTGLLLNEEITTILVKLRYLHQIDQEIKVY